MLRFLIFWLIENVVKVLYNQSIKVVTIMKEKLLTLHNKLINAIRKYPNVLFTHTADMIASQLIELGYDFQINHKKGKWKLNKDGSGTCSECHFTQNGVWDLDNWQNYCGHCGADMR